MTATGCAPPSKYPEDIKNTSTGQSVEVISGWIRASTENAGRGVTESGMVRVLKEAGIGRPSTYSTIISNLSKRGLAGFLPKKNTNIAEIRIGDTCHAEELDAPKSSRQNASFRVTETGDACIRELYNSGLEPFFKVSYTSEMETALDDVAEDKPGTDWKIIVSEVDYQIKEVENNTTIPVTKRGGAFVETILGTKGGWIYGKGRTRYGPVVWKQPEHETKRSYKKVSAKRWHMIELYHAVEML
jgi:DNA topoisomerase IA